MQATMMNVPLSINGFLERAGTIFKRNTLVSRLPDKSLRTHTYGQWHQRTLQLASALQRAGLQKGDRVATLCWNHHAHLEAYFGIPAAGGVMHTQNLGCRPTRSAGSSTIRKRSLQSSAIQPISSADSRRFSVCITPPAAGMPK